MFAKHIISACLIIGALVYSVSAEKVGQVVFKGSTTELNALPELVVPNDIVAMGQDLYMESPDTTESDNGTPSIFFVVDNSGSMEWNDQLSDRYNVIGDIVDTLMTMDALKSTEIGVALFQSRLTYLHTLTAMTPLASLGADSSNSGSYLPLIKLDSTVGGTAAPTLIKSYLEIYKDKISYESNKYTPATTDSIWRIKNSLVDGKSGSSGTNINIGIKALKEAMSKTSNTKKNQYCIFFSDGGASVHWPTNENDNAFTGYQDVPTTFTVFFTDTTIVPTSIRQFTVNVQGQNYSSSNSQSGYFPYKNSTRKELMAFMMDNIIKKIIGNIVTEPSKVIINGKDFTVTWDNANNVAVLDNVNPLTASTTPMNYVLEYLTAYDSIDGSDTIPVEKLNYDTVNFDVKVDPSMTTPAAQQEVKYWNRDINVKNSGSNINLINRDMDSVELSFAFDSIDIKYNYTTVDLQVTNRNGSVIDTEMVTLNKVPGEDRFSLKMPVKTLSSGGAKNNGILEHFPSDTFDVFFKNKENVQLPLDTLSYQIPVYTYLDHVISKSAMFDGNADGKPDTLSITVTDGAVDLSAFKSALLATTFLPSVYTVDVAGVIIDGRKIVIPILYTPSSYKTSLTPSDKVVVSDTLLFGNFDIFYPKSLDIIDSMAPVVTSAYYSSENGIRSLALSFSEDVKDITHTIPFDFVKNDGVTLYTATLSSPKVNGTSATFVIDGLNGTANIDSGDSIFIRTTETNTVTDLLGLGQRNSKNRREPLSVTNSQELKSAALFDGNADGYPDTLIIRASGVRLDLLADVIDTLIDYPSYLAPIPAGIKVDGEKIIIPVSYDILQGYKTSLTGEKITIADTLWYGNGTELSPSDFAIEDSMGAVVTNAFYSTSPNNELTIKFSENINAVTHDIPFTFIVAGSAVEYTAQSNSATVTGDLMKLVPTNFNGAVGIKEGDSVYIRTTEVLTIVDNNGVEQRNTLNRREPITVSHKITAASLFDGNADGYPDTLKIKATGTNLDYLVANFAKLVTLPSFILAGTGITANNGELTIPVDYDKSAGLRTFMSGEKIAMDSVLYTFGVLLPTSVTILDSMAPVAAVATLSDENSKEVLTIKFSEDIDTDITDGTPFIFISKWLNREYNATLSTNKVTDQSTIVFDVKSVDGSVFIEAGDSLYIRTKSITKGIVDKNGLGQTIFNNRHCPIDVHRLIHLDSASLFDMNADGFPDLLKMDAHGLRIDLLTSAMDSILLLPGNLQVLPGTELNNNTFTIPIGYLQSLGAKTATLGDSIVVSDTIIFNSGGNLMPTLNPIAIADSMAPVAIGATFSEDDATLIVDFSEDIETINGALPFDFIDNENGGDLGALSLTWSSQVSNSVTYDVDSASYIKVQNSDSLYINWEAPDANVVKDELINMQNNDENHRVPITGWRNHYLRGAALFDKDANGIPDEIAITIQGALIDQLAAYLNKLPGIIKLPSMISLAGDAVVDGSILRAPVEFNESGLMTSFDSVFTISVDTTIDFLTDIARLLGGTVPILDSMAPVILSGVFVDSLYYTHSDILNLEFSEPVIGISSEEPFQFFNTKGEKYLAKMQKNSQSGNSASFTIVSYDGGRTGIDDGDSINILTTGKFSVTDTLGVIQLNSGNRKIPLSLTKIAEYASIDTTVFYDNNADGKVDSITVKVSGKYAKDNFEEIAKFIPFPDVRNISVKNITWNWRDSVINMVVSSDEERTNTTVDDIFTTGDSLEVGTGIGLFLRGGLKIQPLDSMAPVILSAYLDDSVTTSKNDLITVTFTENVNDLFDDQPFFIKATEQGVTFTKELVYKSSVDNSVSFTIPVIDSSWNSKEARPKIGDSIWISTNVSNFVTDSRSNLQINPGNIHREILGGYIIDPYHLVLRATLTLSKDNGDLDRLKENPDFQDQIETIDDDFIVLSIIADPRESFFDLDSLDGAITILDNTGNVVISDVEFHYDEYTKSMVTIWNTKNSNGRTVSAGAYTAVGKVNFTQYNGQEYEFILKKQIGINRKISIK